MEIGRWGEIVEEIKEIIIIVLLSLGTAFLVLNLLIRSFMYS